MRPNATAGAGPPQQPPPTRWRARGRSPHPRANPASQNGNRHLAQPHGPTFPARWKGAPGAVPRPLFSSSRHFPSCSRRFRSDGGSHPHLRRREGVEHLVCQHRIPQKSGVHVMPRWQNAHFTWRSPPPSGSMAPKVCRHGASSRRRRPKPRARTIANRVPSPKGRCHVVQRGSKAFRTRLHTVSSGSMAFGSIQHDVSNGSKAFDPRCTMCRVVRMAPKATAHAVSPGSKTLGSMPHAVSSGSKAFGSTQHDVSAV